MPQSKTILENLKTIFLGIKYIVDYKCKNNILFGIKQFQLFGIDVICDKNLKCYLLEINKNTNMKNFHSKNEKYQKKKIIKDMYNLVQNKDNLGSFILI